MLPPGSAEISHIPTDEMILTLKNEKLTKKLNKFQFYLIDVAKEDNQGLMATMVDEQVEVSFLHLEF